MSKELFLKCYIAWLYDYGNLLEKEKLDVKNRKFA